jgi:hypothetical protein
LQNRVSICLALAAAAGLLLAWLQPDSYQQDAGHHFVAARWAWAHPESFVTVWNRPLFTFLYSFPAQLSYPIAKLFTLAIALLTAHQTYRLAQQLRIERAWLAIPLIFLQPSFFMISADTMTEPLFALLFVIALRLHTAGRNVAGMIVASLLVTVRPEGFFLAVLWAAWVLKDVPRSPFHVPRSVPGTQNEQRERGTRNEERGTIAPTATVLFLSTGAFLWWLSALFLTGDPLFILHSWPGNWDLDATYGRGTVWIYLLRLPEIAGLVLLVPFVAGLFVSLKRREYGSLTSSYLTLFIVHTILRVSGWFGSAGYARYFVCISPAIAILTLVGWNWFGARFAAASWRPAVARATLAFSAIVCIVYADMAGFYGRDARAVTELHAWFQENPRPITKFVWSQAYMNVLFDRDPSERPVLLEDTARNIEQLRQMPSGTLVFWDADTGPAWYHVTADDIVSAGYTLLYSKSYELDGWLKEGRWTPMPPRRERFYLLYKD